MKKRVAQKIRYKCGQNQSRKCECSIKNYHMFFDENKNVFSTKVERPHIFNITKQSPLFLYRFSHFIWLPWCLTPTLCTENIKQYITLFWQFRSRIHFYVFTSRDLTASLSLPATAQKSLEFLISSRREQQIRLLLKWQRCGPTNIFDSDFTDSVYFSCKTYMKL